MIGFLGATNKLHKFNEGALSGKWRFSNQWIKLGIYFYGNHPLKNIEIVGTIVSRVQYESRASYVVDDGTGVISATHWNYTKLFELGSLIK